DALDSAEYTGSLIILLNEGTSFVKRNMRTLWKKTANSRIELPDYCERSVFEALVNALIHRDYLINGSEVHVDIFDDRLVVYSPGGMPDGTRIQERNIDSIPSTRRNPVLADIFGRLGYMERQGSGLSKIRDAYRNAVNYTEEKEPVFYSDRVEFTVTLKNLNFKAVESGYLNGYLSGYLDGYLNDKKNEEELIVLELINKNPKITLNEIKENMQIARSHVQRIMKRLTDKEIIERVGSKKDGYWNIK
ncbi:MAG TPA: MarR family transcriptional regulator, partial [Candidatus Mediterraneibacter intestinigallinarum]|nr:MarR family transcriptional regulator [Candidatus Mediterraneibacter intestinigallinarum]